MTTESITNRIKNENGQVRPYYLTQFWVFFKWIFHFVIFSEELVYSTVVHLLLFVEVIKIKWDKYLQKICGV